MLRDVVTHRSLFRVQRQVGDIGEGVRLVITRVSQAVQWPSSPDYAEVARAIDAVDRVHNDGTLPSISIRLITPSKFGLQGGFDPNTNRISVASTALDLRSTCWHELGHALDEYGIARGTVPASSFDPALDRWRRAVSQSQRYAEWTAIRRVATNPEFQQHMLYATSASELWARSYAQYIATRTNDRAVLTHFAQLEVDIGLSLALHYQWEAGDFGQIANEIDALFQDMGWL
jgi:hypothetical protein